MNDRSAVVLAMAAALGAMLAVDIHPAAGICIVSGALVCRRPVLLYIGVAALASANAANAWSGLDAPLPLRIKNQEAMLVSDPAKLPHGGVRVEAEMIGRRFQIVAWGSPARIIHSHMAGERLVLSGKVKALSGPLKPWLRRRHVAAGIYADAVTSRGDSDIVMAAGNNLRTLLKSGAESLPSQHRALLLGLTLGDTTDQSTSVRDEFRASGLGHLVAVSGQNVAFLLAIFAPVLTRLPLKVRLASTLLLLLFFLTLTRWEPSVIRATAMAGISVIGFVMGRPARSIRVLAVAVTGVVLIDPFIVGSVGFLLSVGASAGIILLAPKIYRLCRGPKWLARGFSVTLAAQIGVAPVAIPVFGSLPVVSLPANLLAAPAVGPVTIWGILAGLVAGISGGGLAALLHVPSFFLLGWILDIAHWAAALPVGRVTATHLFIAVPFAALQIMRARRGR